MLLANTATRYGAIAKIFHWTIAVLIAAQIPLGIIANDAPVASDADLASAARLFTLHKTLGIAIFALALARIAWAIAQPKPSLLNAHRKAEAFLADLVHWVLYGTLILVPLTGWISHAAATGFAPIAWPFGQSLPLVPKSQNLGDIAATLHVVFQRVLVFSVLLHIAGAVKHHFLDRDATLRRMLPGQPQLPLLASAPRSRWPLVAAPLVFAAAVGISGALGLFTRPDAPVSGPVGAGNWSVVTGTISFTVAQLGQAVTGGFDSWSATIDYDAATGTGSATVTILTGSFRPKTMPMQAMGDEFIAAATHPVAIFAADISATDGQHLAMGTLALRGVTMPVTLPFSLTIDGDIATVSGTTTLDRRDFGMGPSFPNDTQIGFDVRVDVALTARRR